MIIPVKYIVLLLTLVPFALSAGAIQAQNTTSSQVEADSKAAINPAEVASLKKAVANKTEKTPTTLGESTSTKVSTKNIAKKNADKKSIDKKNIDRKAKAKKPKSDSSEHVISLESTITGDKEQPAVSYFIPWQKVGTPDKLRWNMDQKHDDSLKPVDRDVMVRSMKIYQQMNIENPTNH